MQALDKLMKDMNVRSLNYKPVKHKLNEADYLKLITKTDITVELKKKRLITELYKVLIHTFVLHKKGINHGKIIDGVKSNIEIAGGIVIKLKYIDFYLKNILLKEAGIIKKDEKDNAKRSYLEKADLKRLEYNVEKLLQAIVSIDENMLKKYKQRKISLEKAEKQEVKDIRLILNKQIDLLCHLEAKLPPGRVIKRKLLNSRLYTQWVARIFALLAELIENYDAEIKVFQILKRSEGLKRKSELKIKQIVDEQKRVLKLKEDRMLAINQIDKFDKEWESILKKMSICLRL